VTHLFNAMVGLDHREPGLAGAALADDRITIGLIPDGLHVHPRMVALVRRWVGAGRLAIVTDAMAALGMPPGAYRLAGRDCIVDESSARLPGGGLAGSVIGLVTGVANLAKFAGITAEEAALAATVVPARLLGLEAMPMLPAGAPGATAAPAGPAAPR
jgi:N-acetylglucosamine-6-phosphate deacetylase